MIHTGKKYRKIKLQRLRKILIMDIWVVVTSNQLFLTGSKTGTNFPKNKVVTGKTPLFVIGPFGSRHSIFLNIGF